MRIKNHYGNSPVSVVTPVSDFEYSNKQYVDTKLKLHSDNANVHITTDERDKLSGIEPKATVCIGNVTTDGAQTLRNKILKAPVLADATTFQQEYHNLVTSGNEVIDFVNGNKQIIVLTRNVSLTLYAPGIGNYQLIVYQDTVGNRTVTWNNVTLFLGSATAPPVKTTANSRTFYTLYYNGNEFYLAGAKVGG